MKPLLNFIENINLQLNHWKSAKQKNNNNESRRDEEKTGYDFKETNRNRGALIETFLIKLIKTRDWNCHTLPTP